MSNILVLNWFPKGQRMRQSVWQHQHALDAGADCVVYHNAIDPAPRWLRLLPWDAVILHTVFLCARWVDSFPLIRRDFAWIANLKCVKIAIPQDEYDHSDVLDEWLEELDVEHVLTCFGPAFRDLLYPRLGPRATFHEALTGYIHRPTAEGHTQKTTPLSDRPFDLVYRALRLPYWFGSHGALKHEIASVVEDRASLHGLTTDISTRWEDTILSGWLEFLDSGRATIGVESGSSVLDKRGEIKAQISALLAENQALTFEDVDARLPPGWDAYQFFAIGPRHLEAVVTKTCQVLVEGSFSGVLEPERHYIPLRRDFSNLDDVLNRLHDHDALRAMVDRAYDEVYRPGSYDLERLAEGIRAVIPGGRAPQFPRNLVQEADRVAGAARIWRTAASAFAAMCAQEVRARVAAARPAAAARPSTPAGRDSEGGAMPNRTQLAALALRATIRHRARRKLLVRYVRGAGWRKVTPRALARDLLRLAVVDELNSHANHAKGVVLEVDRDADTIVLRTDGDGRGERSPAPEPGIYWDHSAVGPTAPLSAGAMQLGEVLVGERGVYRFDSLVALGPGYRELVRDAVTPAHRAGASDDE